jgi:hypothetical protein
MSAAKYAATRTDGRYIGKTIREIVRLMVEDDYTWQRAADAVGLKRTRAYRAICKPHVVHYRKEQLAQFVDVHVTRVVHRLLALAMSGDNEAASVRAADRFLEYAEQSRAEPTRRIQTGGIVIVLGANAQRALPATTPALELQRIEDEVADG